MRLIAVLLAWATAAAARSKDLDILDGPVKGLRLPRWGKATP